MPLSDEQMSALMSKKATPSAPISDDQMSALMQAHDSGDLPGPAQSFSDNMANTAAFGYAPQIVGGITKALSPSKQDIDSSMGLRSDIASKPDKKNIPYNPYLIGRDSTTQQLASEQATNPKASLAGSVTGAIGSGVLFPTPAALNASSITGGIAKGAALGAGYGAASNPGDVDGQIDPLQLDARKANAIRGAEIGAVTGGVTQAASKGLNALAGAPESLQSGANSEAVKASGAMLKDFRALEGSDKTQALGKFALDNGLVKAGDTFEDVGQKAEALRQDAGSRLDDLYKQAKAGHVAANGEMPDNIGFNPVRDKSQILSQVEDKMGDQVGGKAAVTQVSNYLDELGAKYGDKVLDPKTANNIESAVSKKVNFLRNPLNASPEGEQAFSTVRKIVSDAVDNHIEYLGKEAGDPAVATKLAQANKDYGMSSQISNMAQDKANRVAANSKFGLLDTISAGSGAVAGTIAGEELGGHPFEGGAIGLAGGLASHYLRGHGDAVLAAAMNNAGKLSSYGPSQVAGLASKAINPNILSRGITQSQVVNGAPKEYYDGGKVTDDPKPTSPPTSPIDPNAAADVQASMRKAFHFANGGQIPGKPLQAGNSPVNDKVPALVSPGEVILPNSITQSSNAAELAKQFVNNIQKDKPMNPQSNSQPPGGIDKWALDGFHNLRNHVGDDDRKILDEAKNKMLLDPKMKNLLVTASNYEPGSKPLDDIIGHLKKSLK